MISLHFSVFINLWNIPYLLLLRGGQRFFRSGCISSQIIDLQNNQFSAVLNLWRSIWLVRSVVYVLRHLAVREQTTPAACMCASLCAHSHTSLTCSGRHNINVVLTSVSDDEAANRGVIWRQNGTYSKKDGR